MNGQYGRYVYGRISKNSERVCTGRRCGGRCGDHSDPGREQDYIMVYVYRVYSVRNIVLTLVAYRLETC